MDFKLNFQKNEISKKVTKFLLENLPNEEDKNSIRRIEKKNKLNYMDANSLIQALLQAIILDDGEDDVPLSQDILEDKSLDDLLNPSPGSSGTQKNQVTSDQGKEEKKSHLQDAFSKDDPKNICRFYRNGKCKFNTDCRYAHPAICKTFRKFGLGRNNVKGCDGKCE